MSSPWPLAPALTALGGAAVGFVLASAYASDGGAPASAPAAVTPTSIGAQGGADPNLAALLEEVRALGDRIERLAPRSAPVAASSERTALPADAAGTDGAPSTAQLTALLDRCTQLLERLELQSARSSGAGRLAPAPSTASRDGLLALDFTDKDLDQQLTRQHRLSGYQDVLDRHGPPDHVWNTSNSIKVLWNYDLELRNGDTYDVTFEFLDGMVSRVYE